MANLAYGRSSPAGLFVLLAGPWPLDRARFEGQPYAIASLRSLDRDAAAGSTLPSAGELRAGYAEADITARPGEPLAGYGQRGLAVCAGIHDRQSIRALVAHGPCHPCGPAAQEAPHFLDDGARS